MKQTLIGLGWKMVFECTTCKGLVQTYEHKDHPGYEIKATIRTNIFSILKQNRIVAGPHWGYQITKKLSEFTWI